MATTVVDLFDITEGQLKKSIRYHEESRSFSIIDVIMVLTGKDRNQSSEVFRRMVKPQNDDQAPSLTSCLNFDLITKHKFPGRGQTPTSVAPFVVILQVCRSNKTITHI